MSHGAIPSVDIIHECIVIRHGLSAMLQQSGAVRVGRTSASVLEHAQSRLEGAAPVLVLSPRAARLIGPVGAASSPPALIVVDSNLGEHAAREALQAGVMGLLLLSVDERELLAAVDRVRAGRRYVTPTVALAMAEHVCSPALTCRELDLLGLIAKGLSNKSAARQLAISAGTVKTHVRSIFTKLDVSNRTEAVMVARARGMFDVRGAGDDPRQATALPPAVAKRQHPSRPPHPRLVGDTSGLAPHLSAH
jgi:DNA-binding NarL/FixJ family response regulator